jgi:hypothetical protein
MHEFLTEFAFILGALLILAACGLGLVAPFASRFPFVLLASPQAGLLLLSTATQAIYSVLYLPIGKALLIATPTCLALTGISLFATGFRPRLREILSFAVFAVLFSAVYAVASCASSIATLSPSMLYSDGTDHLGYANLADWMRDHPPSHDMAYRGVEPRADPTFPYQSLPNIMLISSEPRMGAFTFLGIIGTLRGVPSSYAYDLACAIALAAAVLGVASVFTTRLAIFVTLALGLAIAHWYDFTHAGFFGKALAYPSILFAVGLFFLSRGDYRPWIIAVLLTAAAGSALMLSGYVTALLLLVLGMPAIFLDALHSRRVEMQDIAVLGLMAAFAVAASGFFVRPYGGTFPGDPHAVLATALRAFEIEGWRVTTGMAQPIVVVLLALGVVASLSLVVFAYLRQQAAATALLLAPLVFLIVLLACRKRDVAFQLTGFFYPATICGAAMFASSRKQWGSHLAENVACVVAIGFIIGTRMPRAWSAVRRYTDSAVLASHTISLDEFDAIERIADGRAILVDLGSGLQLPIAVLVELGRRNLQLQWTPATWHSVVGGWRPSWQIPIYPAPAQLRLVSRNNSDTATPILSTRNFLLIRNEQK